MSGHEISLETAVREIRSLLDGLDSGRITDESSSERQAQIQRTISLCHACEDAITRGGFFSENEELDDIPTHSLLYLLFPYYSALLTQHIRPEPNPTGDTTKIVERTTLLGDVRRTLRDFVQQMIDLGVLAKEDCTITLNSLDAEISDFTGQRGSASSTPRVDAAAARSEKISAMKRKKVTKALLDSIVQRKLDKKKHRGIVSEAEEEEEAARAKAARSGFDSRATGVYIDDEDDDDDDEETERQMKIVILKYASLVALDELSGVVREEGMLTQIARMKMLGTYDAIREKEAKELAAKKASGKKPFTITSSMLNQRERFAKDVFKPFNPATIMPDDPRALAEDDALSSIRAEERRRAAGLPADPEEEHKSEDDDSDKETEASLRKAREWDEFKDENPRGWGNSKGIG